jgi:hypothetical protein
MYSYKLKIMSEVQEKDNNNNNNNNESSFTKKRNRKHSAQSLPNGLEHHMMKKYVVYYREWIDRSHTKEREYFKIEKHPDLSKSWTSSKSSKVKLTDKLAEANKVIDDLEKKRKEELEKQKIENY